MRHLVNVAGIYPLTLASLAELQQLGFRYLVMDPTEKIVHARKQYTISEKLDFLGMTQVEISTVKEITPDVFGTMSEIKVSP